VVSGEGSIDRLGELAKELGFSRTLLVADAGLVKAGHLEHARASLEAAAVDTIEFSDFGPNPDADMLEAGRRHAAGKRIDSIIGLGGGSSLDCAKGINFLLTQGGAIHDFQGYGKAMKPMLPMIGVPTTAGTGSEAQSYAIISDPRTHKKMACGDPKATFRAVILDPRLTLTQPPSVTAAAGYDAIAHAVESFVCTTRTARSQARSLEAWRLLEANFERVLAAPDDLAARASMQLGAFHAGTAIELSMLGATHACANPVTARYGTTHGNAIAILLPHVVRWNASVAAPLYSELLRSRAPNAPDAPIAPNASDAPNAPGAEALAMRLSVLAAAGDLPRTLRETGASSGDLAALASEAAEQWTGTFNPRPFDTNGALEIYQCAF
jgi:alcohol dehydrogenase